MSPRLVALALLMIACGSSSKPERCVFKDATFSVGATQCMPSPRLEGGVSSVYECVSTPSNEKTTVMVGEWRDTQRPCKP